MHTDIPRIQPHEFIQELFSGVPDGWIEICYLAPEGVKLFPRVVVHWAKLPLPQLPAEMPTVKKMNMQGYSVFFGATTRARRYDPETRISERTQRPYQHYQRGKEKDALYLSALWVDIDLDGNEGYQKAIGAFFPPSIIVASGGGYHAYWMLVEPIRVTDENRVNIHSTLRGLALDTGGDTKVAELARIMRLPGTVNTKPGRGVICEVVDYLPARYHFDEIQAYYAPLGAPVYAPIDRSIPAGAGDGLPRWVQTYLDSGESQGNRNNRAYAAARAMFDSGLSYAEIERLIISRACADGLAESAVKATVASAYRAPRGTPNLDSRMRHQIGSDDHLLKHRKRNERQD